MHETPHHTPSPLGVLNSGQKTLAVAVGLIVKGNKVLLGKRTSGYYSGFWEYPGGKIEAGESSYSALIREMHEELDICVSDATEVMHIKEQHPHTTVHLQAWHIHSFEGSIIANEQQELQWCAIKRLNKTQVIPTNFPITQFLTQLVTER